ncbi:MAG: helix-turn-helix domain-containing protein [Parabacteroides sp.]
MKRDLLYDNILDAIRGKIPNRGMLTNTLADLLSLEKEAVYRRLRGEVAFSFSEIAVIASTLGISLDNQVGARYAHSRPFQLRLIEYVDSGEIDYEMLEHYIYIHNQGKEDKKSKAMDCSGVLPQSLYLAYKNISRFFLFKWIYQNKDLGQEPFVVKDVYPTCQSLEKIQERGALRPQNLSAVTLLGIAGTPLIFCYLANDINYFTSVNLLGKEDLQLLKKELLQFLDDMELLAIKGKFDDTGNSVYFYISSTNFDTSYRCVEVKHLRVSLIRAFTLNAVVSLDRQTYERISGWLQAVIRSSTMISVSGARQRICFFEKQRSIIKAL